MTELRASSKRKESRVNVLLRPIAESEHKFKILIKKEKEYREFELSEYFCDEFLVPSLLSPFSFLPPKFLEQKYLIQAYPKGGGLSSQAKAITLAISKALLSYHPEIKSALRGANLLTKDSRVKERKKIGKYKARRSPQFTKR